MREIHKRKGLKKSQKILDHMGSTELAANLFRATQTDEKLRRDKVKGKKSAGDVHEGKRFVKQLKNWAELCRKIYRHQERVSSRFRENKKRKS